VLAIAPTTALSNAESLFCGGEAVRGGGSIAVRRSEVKNAAAAPSRL
jgi:hypothetical protein